VKAALLRMNHPNRNWQRRWTVDFSACTATHDSGLVVRFAAHPDAQRMSVEPSHLANQRLLDEASRLWKRVAGVHVSNYVIKCTNGIIADTLAWKVKVPEPKNDLERCALSLFLDEIERSVGVKPNIETWQ
jgi:hypothetical protein